MSFPGFLRFFTAVILILTYAAFARAATDNGSLSSAPIMNPTGASSKNITMEINSDWFAGDLTKLTSASFTSERRNVPLIDVREYFENLAAVSLLKDRDNAVWSLAPSFGKYSINPLNDLKNVQVLLQYRF